MLDEPPQLLGYSGRLSGGNPTVNCIVQGQLVKDCTKRASWRARGVRVLGCAAGVFCVLFFGYFGPVSVKPKTTYGWAWQNTYYKYGYLAGTIEAASLMADPIIEPEN